MNSLKIFLGAALALGVVFGMSLGADEKKDEKKDPKTIKDIMKEAHAKDGLFDQLKGGTLDEKGKKQLAELYADLPKNKPPVGDEDAWKKTTTTINDAAKEMVDGKDKDGKKLVAAVKCMDCHKAFRKPK